VGEIRELLSRRVTALQWKCEDTALRGMAERSRGVPRVALRLLDAVHRVGRSENADQLTLAHLERMCRIEGIDARGLDRTEQAYLRILDAAGKPVRLGAIADQLGLPTSTVSGVLESWVFGERFI
jgi:Holliday junction DNA helicase RuvB